MTKTPVFLKHFAYFLVIFIVSLGSLPTAFPFFDHCVSHVELFHSGLTWIQTNTKFKIYSFVILGREKEEEEGEKGVREEVKGAEGREEVKGHNLFGLHFDDLLNEGMGPSQFFIFSGC